MAWLVVIVADRTLGAAADLADKAEVTRATVAVPLYRPFLPKQLVAVIMDWPKSSERKLLAAGQRFNGRLAYPKAPLTFQAPQHPPAIVWLVIESFRTGEFDERVTPELARLGAESLLFPRNVAGGNHTRFGLFSLFSGLHGTYWHAALAENRASVLFDRLQDLDYRFFIASSASFEAPPLDRTSLVGVRRHIWKPPAGTGVQRDRAVTEQALRFLAEQQPGQPFVLLIMLDATHAPYHLPPGDQPFTPYVENVSYHELGDPAEAPGLLNRYRNALHFVDAMAGEILAALKQRGLFDEAVVIVTGDHGEAFFEHGVWGHNTDFDREQIDTPLILHVPGVAPAVRDQLARAVDLVPTLMELLGTTSKPSQYSSGRSLLHGAPAAFALTCGWDECAVRDDDGFTTVFSTSDESRVGYRVLDPQHHVSADAPSRNLSAALIELRAFFR